MDVYARLQETGALSPELSLTHLVQFIIFCSVLKRDILLTQKAGHNPELAPEFLPTVVQQLLAKVLGAPAQSVQQCWTALRELVWNTDTAEMLRQGPEAAFKAHGHSAGLSECSKDSTESIQLNEIQKHSIHSILRTPAVPLRNARTQLRSRLPSSEKLYFLPTPKAPFQPMLWIYTAPVSLTLQYLGKVMLILHCSLPYHLLLQLPYAQQDKILLRRNPRCH